jgi:hypothetical protein
MDGNASVRTTADNGGQGVLELEFFLYNYLDVPYMSDGVGIIAMVRNLSLSIEQAVRHVFLSSRFTTIRKYRKLTSMASAWLPIVNIFCYFQRKQCHFSVRHTPIAQQQFELI